MSKQGQNETGINKRLFLVQSEKTQRLRDYFLHTQMFVYNVILPFNEFPHGLCNLTQLHFPIL